jgi:hypothetical protein
MKSHRWHHNFGHGLTCTATFTEAGTLACEWSRRPPVGRRGHMRAYVRWMRHAVRQAARITGQPIVMAIQVGGAEWVTIEASPTGEQAIESGKVV